MKSFPKLVSPLPFAGSSRLFNQYWLKALRTYKAIAVIRAPNLETGLAMGEAVANGGMRLIEVTWNSEQPQELISELRSRLPDCLIGAGTILNLVQLQEAIASGSQFLFSPYFNPNLLDIAINRYNVPFIPGVLSPTEIVNAWQAGATTVKVFPVQSMGGAKYIKSLQSPIGQIPLIPTGGITIENAPQMLRAGAIAVGLSSNLFPSSLVKSNNWQDITDRTRNFVKTLEEVGSKKIKDE
ncbi:MAG: bifunctional 4-hydroxy-2-oxoglutarate aldolase/2-dehydro-3-deoxy-phosphogluconate aldolase [Xenococcaceae cyanobacterium MO_207.B15]|nr:bifunctional 4-hydroxy-2-oxoglutarate aldolase/2-dehydro-3-deoxy-phosphogluconate aldolase [Xenococcaceae cyanobacterium MO_207.B15]